MRLAQALGVLFAAVLAAAPSVHAQGPAKEPSGNAPTSSPGEQVDLLPSPDVTKWTGDLDVMIERRMIRVLTTFSKTNYFVDRGTQRGVVYDAFRLLEDDLNKKLKLKHAQRVHALFVPVSRDDLIPALLDGRGDIAAANLTIMLERLKRVDFSNPTGRNVSEIVVTGPGAPPIATVDDLSGQEVFIRKSSSFYESVEALNARFSKERKKPVKIRAAPEELENEDILEMVNAGLVKVSIVDDHVAEFWKRIFPNIVPHKEVAVRTGGEIGWMIRKGSPKLKAELDALLARYPEGSARRNQLLQSYYKNTKWAKAATSKEGMARFEKTVELFSKYGDKYSVDYLLLMAQGYQESQLNQEARSPVGAIGVMQVMPATGKDMGVGDITKLEHNIHAGVKYVRFMMDEFYEDEPMDRLNKGLFTFASYNAGPGRLQQLRRLAEKRGLDPNKWFNNVELVAAEKIGRETVQYVSNIFKYYLAYRMVTEEREARARAKADVTGDRK